MLSENRKLKVAEQLKKKSATVQVLFGTINDGKHMNKISFNLTRVTESVKSWISV